MASRDAIEHEITYPYGIDVVWEALTESEQLSEWLMATDFTASVGSRFTFRDHEPWPDGVIYDVVGEILVCDPPRRLAYTWASPPKHGETVVEWNLFPVKGGTLVRLRHSGFESLGKAGQEAIDMLRDGWGGLLSDELMVHLRDRCDDPAKSAVG